jgi:hypothetical protein
MDESQNINAILVRLLVGGEQALFILLRADGSINRLGTGSANNTERDMFIGGTDPELFQHLRARITAGLLGWCGRSLSAAQQLGKSCELTIGFMEADGHELMTAWRYGSESQGPPREVGEFVVAAVEMTTPWYEHQKTIVSGSGNDGADT